MTTLLVAEIFGTIVALVVGGLMVIAPFTPKDRKAGSFLFLTCWAWPLWLLFALGHVALKAFRTVVETFKGE